VYYLISDPAQSIMGLLVDVIGARLKLIGMVNKTIKWEKNEMIYTWI